MKKVLLTCLTLLLLLGSLSGLPADTSDAENSGGDTRGFVSKPPAEIQNIINPEPSFYVRAWVDHEDGVYREGETMTVWAQSEEDGWIYVIYQNAENKKALLFPNKYRSNNRVRGNKEIRIPADETKEFSLECSAPFGKEYLTVIVSKKPLKTVAEKDLGDQFTVFDEVFYREFCNEVRVRDKGMRTAPPTGDKPKTETTDTVVNPPKKDKPPKEEKPGIEWAEDTVEITTYAKAAKVDVHEPERYFFGIALDKYDDKGIPTLPACVNDLNKVKETFISDCGVPAENAKVLVNEEATYDNIKDLFYNVIPEMTKHGDIVFIYWSGHGNRIANTGASNEEYSETLIAYDSDKFKKNTQILDDEFGVWAQKFEGRKVLFILDACYSGGMGEKELATKSIDKDDNFFRFGMKQLVRTKGLGQDELALIGSSAADERSMCIGDESAMTKVMLETLKSKKGVSHTDLWKDLKGKVRALAKEKGHGFSQHPYFQDGLSEPLILNP